MNTPVNQTIHITAVGFNGQTSQGQLQSFPKRMLWDDREYTFAEIGMHYLIKKGQELVRLFDVSDGQTDYRLRCDGHDQWTLVSLKVVA